MIPDKSVCGFMALGNRAFYSRDFNTENGDPLWTEISLPVDIGNIERFESDPEKRGAGWLTGSIGRVYLDGVFEGTPTVTVR